MSDGNHLGGTVMIRISRMTFPTIHGPTEIIGGTWIPGVLLGDIFIYFYSGDMDGF